MSEQNHLLLGFVRTTARHSGLRGDSVTSLFDAVSVCLKAGTATPQIAFAAASLVGENLLVAHEIELLAAVDASGLATVAPDPGASAAALLDGTAPQHPPAARAYADRYAERPRRGQ